MDHQSYERDYLGKTRSYIYHHKNDEEDDSADEVEYLESPQQAEKLPRQESMSEWIQRQASSHSVQLAATAVASGLLVAGTIFGVQAVRRQVAVEDLKASIPNIDEGHAVEKLPTYKLRSPFASKEDKEEKRIADLAWRAQEGHYDQDLIDEQLTRTSSFLTPQRLAKLRSSFIIVIGLGGVGSHCTSALLRSGVSRIRIVDFDQVTLSSLNRHAVATLGDVGTPKVQCVRKRLEAVVPWVQWECFNELWRESSADRLLGRWGNGSGPKPDYIVDAIDNIDSKVALLKYCHERGIKVISSMGAGCKSDPARIYVGDISASIEDPLSRTTRRRLKLLGITEGIPVVFSTEKAGPGKASLLPLPDEEFQKGNVNELSVLPDFRARILPVLGTMPASFGLIAANYIIMEITGYPHELIANKNREKTYETILGNLLSLEQRLVQSQGEDIVGLKIPVTNADVGFLVDEVYRGKSVVSGLSTRLALVRWKKPAKGFAVDTRWEGQKSVRLELQVLVLMTREEAAMHEKEILLGEKAVEDMYDEEVLRRVAARTEEQRAFAAQQ
ncbi:hypothetical protein MMC25_003579 [Agyrium rufum]|nr:hypothetical protein [Agyrium rufum]